MRNVRVLAAGLIALVMTGLSSPSRACSFGDTPHVLDPAAQASDQIAPTLSPPTLVKVERGQDTGGACASDSCDGTGNIVVAAAPSDDATPAEKIGFRLTVAAGTPPQGFTLPKQAIRATGGTGGQLWLHWDDGTGDHASFAFTLQIVAIDLAGNESAPQTLEIADGGSGGCRVAGRAPPVKPGTLALLLVGLFALARRRARAALSASCRDR